MLFEWNDIVTFTPKLLEGAKLTVLLTVVVMAIALVLGLLLALGRLSHTRLLRWPATAYVEFIRGTPLLLQLFYLYFVLPFLVIPGLFPDGIKLPALVAGIIGLSLNYSAYLSEVYRAGIQAVDRGQTEAALSLGMSGIQTMRLVVLPQAIRTILPPIANYFISLFKDTSLVSVITLTELMFTGEILAASTFKHIEIFTMIALIYFAMCYPSSLFVGWLERRLRTGYRRAQPKGGAKPGAMVPLAEAR